MNPETPGSDGIPAVERLKTGTGGPVKPITDPVTKIATVLAGQALNAGLHDAPEPRNGVEAEQTMALVIKGVRAAFKTLTSYSLIDEMHLQSLILQIRDPSIGMIYEPIMQKLVDDVEAMLIEALMAADVSVAEAYGNHTAVAPDHPDADPAKPHGPACDVPYVQGKHAWISVVMNVLTVDAASVTTGVNAFPIASKSETDAHCHWCGELLSVASVVAPCVEVPV